MLSNTACTLLNYYRNGVTQKEEWRFTVLDAVAWFPSKASNVLKSGLQDADALNVHIPKNVYAQGKSYLPPKQYAQLNPDQVDQYWTLSVGIKGKQDRIVKGEIQIMDIKDVIALDDSFVLSTVDTHFYDQEDMQHWEVGAK